MSRRPSRPGPLTVTPARVSSPTEAANAFGSQGDQRVPPEFGKLLVSLWGDKAFQTPFWSCNLLAECLATADEKSLKALMSQGKAHACPLPPPANLPPPRPLLGCRWLGNCC